MNCHLILTLIFTAAIATTAVDALPHFFPNISSVDPSLIPNTTAGAWESFLKLTGCSKGQTVAGLSKIKSYFSKFGYINGTPANFTDDFDDLLESAIKTYQTNFNLKPTGVLDGPTVKQIVQPRCGVADMINGTSTMNAGKAPPPSGEHINTVGHYSFFPGSPRWPASKRDLTYAFFPENNLTDSVKMVFALAFERWSEVIPMTFTETSSYSSADIQIGFASGEHGDGEPFDGPLGTLAHAFSPPNGHFHLDGDENWVVDGDFSPSMLLSGVDLESVAVHEIGHLLGLGHSSVEGAIMFPSITSATRKVALAGDDIEGIQVLYGSNPNYNGSSVPTTQQRETSGSGPPHVDGRSWSLGLVLTVGLVILALSRN